MFKVKVLNVGIILQFHYDILMSTILHLCLISNPIIYLKLTNFIVYRVCPNLT